MAVLCAASEIKRFKFDPKKFLNGLTEEEFIRITRTLKSDDDLNKAPPPYQEVIRELVLPGKSEEHNYKNTSYLGQKENVTFQMKAAMIEYDHSLEQLVRKYNSINISLTPQRSWAFGFIDLSLGETRLSTPSDQNGKVLYRDIRHCSPLDAKLQEALFKSVYHSDSIFPGLIPRAYEIAILNYAVRSDSARYTKEKQLTVEIREGRQKKKAAFGLGMLTFLVEAEIQYRFTPVLGGFEILYEVFDLRGYHGARVDKNIIEPALEPALIGRKRA